MRIIIKRNLIKPSKRLPINDEIRAKEIRLIGASGEQMGIVSLDEALNQAKESSLDLVQMAKAGEPIVCKLLDHGKYVFNSKKQKSASKKKQKRIQVKEIKFRPVTEENDYQIKVNKIKSFLEEGNKAKITLRFRGREMAHQNIGLKLLKRVEVDLQSLANVEQFPTLEGRQLVMMMAPIKR